MFHHNKWNNCNRDFSIGSVGYFKVSPFVKTEVNREGSPAIKAACSKSGTYFIPLNGIWVSKFLVQQYSLLHNYLLIKEVEPFILSAAVNPNKMQFLKA